MAGVFTWILVGLTAALRSFTFSYMNSVISAPVDWIESVGNLRLPPKTDLRLQGLMHRNNEGLLSDGEREELEALVELSEQLSLVRAEALQMLGKQPE
jgi:hypothetical protein